jgi:hypothetical protein
MLRNTLMTQIAMNDWVGSQVTQRDGLALPSASVNTALVALVNAPFPALRSARSATRVLAE